MGVRHLLEHSYAQIFGSLKTWNGCLNYYTECNKLRHLHIDERWFQNVFLSGLSGKVQIKRSSRNFSANDCPVSRYPNSVEAFSIQSQVFFFCRAECAMTYNVYDVFCADNWSGQRHKRATCVICKRHQSKDIACLSPQFLIYYSFMTFWSQPWNDTHQKRATIHALSVVYSRIVRKYM